jgi:opacity protein-like surface antigen
MIKSILAVFVAGGLLAAPIQAEEVVMTRPIQAGSLHAGVLDMVAYWTPQEDGGYELVATFRARNDEAQPMRVVMKLMAGDSVGFSMPGYLGLNYRFTREDNQVTATATCCETGAGL